MAKRAFPSSNALSESFGFIPAVFARRSSALPQLGGGRRCAPSALDLK